MPRQRTAPKPLDTIWEVSDDLWARLLPILQDDWQPSPKGGQPPKDWRRILNGILHVAPVAASATCRNSGRTRPPATCAGPAARRSRSPPS